MWANAQRDGRPAEYRWRPLFNLAKFGWRQLLECRACSNAANTRNPLKFAGVPQTRQRISAISGPKFTILRRNMEEVLLFNKFFSDCRYMPSLQRYSATICAMVPKWRFLRPVFFTPCVEVWQTSSLQPLRLGEEKKKKKERRRKIETTGRKYNILPYYGHKTILCYALPKVCLLIHHSCILDVYIRQ